MKKTIALAALALTLSGCVVYPAPYYGRAYVAPPAAVVVAPRPYYYWHY
jgi:PBP1b-binding outer membrane lipoprotein LpoB